MSGIGIDIKEAYVEVGTAFTIIRDAGDYSGEYLDFDINRQATKPFIRGFFLECSLPFDTSGETGDILSFDTTRDKYLVINKTPDIFENEIIEYSGVLYQCNVSGELFRPAEGRDDQYHTGTTWETIKTNAYGLQTETLFGTDLDTDEELGMLGIDSDELYLPKSYGVQVLDRYQPSSGEYYRVESIKTRKFPGVVVVKLGEDQR